MIDDVQITNSHIMVAGSMAVEDEGTKIVVYDYDGNQLLKLGGEDISSPDKYSKSSSNSIEETNSSPLSEYS